MRTSSHRPPFHQNQQQSSSAAGGGESEEEQEVNRIFIDSTIEQVAATCRQMQQDVRQTQLELRQMVGNRHRELIDCCGELVGIDKVCRELSTLCDDASSVSSSSSLHSKSNFQQQQEKAENKKNNNKEKSLERNLDDTNNNNVIPGHKTWFDQQMLRVARSSKLVEEGQLLPGAVQISQLERDIAIGLQSLEMSYNYSSHHEKNNNDTNNSSLSSSFHILDANVKPLKSQWNVSAAKSIANLTCSSSSSFASEKETIVHGNNSSNEQQQDQQEQSALILVSCFQGWGLLSRGTPTDAMNHLLSTLCPQALDRIKSSSSSSSNNNCETEALTRSSRLVVMISSFLLDLYRRGPLSLITTDSLMIASKQHEVTASTATTSNASPSSTSAFSSLSYFFQGIRGQQQQQNNTNPTSNNNVISELVKLRDNHNQQQQQQPSSSDFLNQVAFNVCALGILDANNSTNPSSSSSSLASSVQGGWASPTINSPEFFRSSPSNNNNNSSAASTSTSNNNNSQSSFSQLLPSLSECSQMFDKSCKEVFSVVMKSFIEHSSDPASGERAVTKTFELPKKNLKLSSSSSSSSNSSSSSEISLLASQLLESINTVCNSVASAAGTCILRHLSESASRLLSATLNGTKKSSSSESLFVVLKNLVAASSNNNTNNTNINLGGNDFMMMMSSLSNTSSSSGSTTISASNRGREMLSALVRRPKNNKRIQNSNTNISPEKQSIVAPPSSPLGNANTINSTTTIIIMNHLQEISKLINEATIHAKSALKRSLSVNDIKSTEQVVSTILELTNGLSDAARQFFKSFSSSSTSDEKEKNSKNNQELLFAGIAAAETVRIVCSPLLQVASSELSLSSSSPQQQTTTATISSAQNVLTKLQTELLEPWKSDIRSGFEQDISMIQNDTYCDPVLSGSILVCRTATVQQEQQQQQSSSTTSKTISYPNQASPGILAALVKAVRRATSILVPLPSLSLLYSSSSSSNINNNNNSNSNASSSCCPNHVRLDLCAQLCNTILQQKYYSSTTIENIKKSFETNHFSEHERDMRLLQLYFDAMFMLLVLRGSSSSTSNSNSAVEETSAFIAVDGLRKDFARKIEASCDVVTWSVSKSYIHSSVKQAVDESSFITTILPSNLSSSSTITTTTTKHQQQQNRPGLQLAVNNPSERLPLLPLASLATTASGTNRLNSAAAAAAAAAGGTTSGSNVGGSGSLFDLGGLLSGSGGEGAAANITGGDGSTTAAEKLLARGSEFTNKMKSVLQWF